MKWFIGLILIYCLVTQINGQNANPNANTGLPAGCTFDPISRTVECIPGIALPPNYNVLLPPSFGTNNATEVYVGLQILSIFGTYCYLVIFVFCTFWYSGLWFWVFDVNVFVLFVGLFCIVFCWSKVY